MLHKEKRAYIYYEDISFLETNSGISYDQFRSIVEANAEYNIGSRQLRDSMTLYAEEGNSLGILDQLYKSNTLYLPHFKLEDDKLTMSYVKGRELVEFITDGMTNGSMEMLTTAMSKLRREIVDGEYKVHNSMSAGKGLRAIFDEIGDVSYSDATIERIVNSISGLLIPDEIVSVDELGYLIAEAYNEDRVASSGVGSLAESCMRHDNCADYVRFYDDLKAEGVVDLLVSVNSDDMITGRALLWETSEGVFMDRVYGSDKTQQSFLNRAKQEGWMYLSEQTYGMEAQDIVGLRGGLITVKASQKAIGNGEGFPYMDTLGNFCPDGGYLTTKCNTHLFEFKDLNGGYTTEELEYRDDTEYYDDMGNCLYESPSEMLPTEDTVHGIIISERTEEALVSSGSVELTYDRYISEYFNVNVDTVDCDIDSIKYAEVTLNGQTFTSRIPVFEDSNLNDAFLSLVKENNDGIIIDIKE